MNEKQIKLLNDNGYEVLTEVNLIHDKNDKNALIQIAFDKDFNKFYIETLSASISPNSLQAYQNYITIKVLLVEKLNSLGGK